MSFIKADVFLKKLERYLRAGHGLDLIVEDTSDSVHDSLDGSAHLTSILVAKLGHFAAYNNWPPFAKS